MTKFMTNAGEIARKLRRNCNQEHAHIKLDGGNRTRQSEVYPDELCEGIVRGLTEQMKKDGRVIQGEMRTVCSVENEWNGCEENQEEEIRQYWDDMSGKELNPELVKRPERMRWRSSGCTECT